MEVSRFFEAWGKKKKRAYAAVGGPRSLKAFRETTRFQAGSKRGTRKARADGRVITPPRGPHAPRDKATPRPVAAMGRPGSGAVAGE